MKALLLVLVAVGLMCLPQSALASCRNFSITMPDGKILNCTECNGQVYCS